MRIYITDAQVPELAPFPPAARRALRHSAFQQMFAAQPRLRWLPNGFCVVGVLVGWFTLGELPRSLYTWSGDHTGMFISTGYILLLAWVGGFAGAQWLTHRARPYLRRLISSDGHSDTTA
jgi:hypothetical protein